MNSGDRTAPSAAETEAAFAQFLAQQAEGTAVEFDDFCKERPHLASSLQRLHQSWRGLQGEPRKRKSLGEHIQEAVGEEKERGDVDSVPISDVGALSDRIQKLASRVTDSQRYTFQGEVARGGMGVILRVWDEDLRRTLAMKSVLGKVRAKGGEATPLIDMQIVSRFLEEAQITGQMDHPGVLPVHELGVDDAGRLFFTMPLVRGKTLDEIFKLARQEKEDWNRPRALNVMLRVCEAMAYAHSKGVIHRDLKPSNVMVGSFGETYVMDWGLAKVLGKPEKQSLPIQDSGAWRTQIRTDRVDDLSHAPSSPLVTMDGTVVGTPAFMPPEQAEGRVEDLDRRSDVYSVGSMLYMLLSGRMPYIPADRGIAPHEVLLRLISGPPTPVCDLDTTIPAELAAICEKAMARSPDDRYDDMLEMAHDVRSYLEGRVVRAHQTGAVAEFRKWVARNKATAAAVAAILVLVVCGSTFFAFHQRSQVRKIASARHIAEAARQEAEANAKEARKNAAIAAEHERLAQAQQYVASLVAADANLRMFEAREAKHRLNDCPEDLRGWEWRHLELRTNTSRRVLRGHRGRATAVAVSPDGRWVVSGGEDGTIRLWEAESGDSVLADLPGLDDSPTALAYSSDGKWIAAAAAAGNMVWIWNADRRRLERTLPGHVTRVTSIAFSGDSKRIAAGATDGSARVWDTRTWQEVAEIAGGDASASGVAAGPHGTRIAVAAGDIVRVVDVDSGKEIRRLEVPAAGFTSVALDDMAERVVAGATDKSVRVWDIASGDLLHVLDGHDDPVYAVAFEEGDGRVASASFDKSLRIWDVETGRAVAVHLGHDGPINAVAWHAGSDRLFSASDDGSIRIWDTRGEGPVRTIGEFAETSVNQIALDRGGRVAAALSGVDVIPVWRLDSAKEDVLVRGLEQGILALAFSPDGTRLLAGPEEDWEGWVYEIDGEGKPKRLEGHEGAVRSVAFRGDGKVAATGSDDGTIRLWDAATWKLLRVLGEDKGPVRGIVFQPGGTLLASACEDHTIRLWNSESGGRVKVLSGHDGPVRAVAFDATGKRLASASADQTIRVWTVGSENEPLELTGHEKGVLAVAFSPDGKRLVSGGQDKTVRLWHAETGQMLVTLGTHGGWVNSVAFSRDGKQVLSGADDGTVRVWESERR